MTNLKFNTHAKRARRVTISRGNDDRVIVQYIPRPKAEEFTDSFSYSFEHDGRLFKAVVSIRTLDIA